MFDKNQKAGKRIEIEITDSVAIGFVWCPAGQVQIGTVTDEDSYLYAYEVPPIMVELTKGFWIAETPLTRQQVSVLGYSKKSYYELSEKSPASQLTWMEAIDICETLTEMIQQTNSDPRFIDIPFEISLPTEAQWEYACRATRTTKWFFGDNENDLVNYAWYKQLSGMLPEVKLKLPNPWGLYDLYGMVYEWCLDRMMTYKNWHNKIDPCIDENHPLIAENMNKYPSMNKYSFRMVRGGCIDFRAEACHSASRVSLADFNSDNDLTGIRPVLKQIVTK